MDPQPSLLESYRKDPRVERVTELLNQSDPQRLHLKGLEGASAALIGASTYLEGNSSHLFVLDDELFIRYCNCPTKLKMFHVHKISVTH